MGGPRARRAPRRTVGGSRRPSAPDLRPSSSSASARTRCLFPGWSAAATPVYLWLDVRAGSAPVLHALLAAALLVPPTARWGPRCRCWRGWSRIAAGRSATGSRWLYAANTAGAVSGTFPPGCPAADARPVRDDDDRGDGNLRWARGARCWIHRLLPAAGRRRPPRRRPPVTAPLPVVTVALPRRARGPRLRGRVDPAARADARRVDLRVHRDAPRGPARHRDRWPGRRSARGRRAPWTGTSAVLGRLAAIELGLAAVGVALMFLWPAAALPVRVAVRRARRASTPRAVLIASFLCAVLVMLLAGDPDGQRVPVRGPGGVRRRRRRVGRGRPGYAANTLGGVFGASAAGFLLLPAIGLRATMAASPRPTRVAAALRLVPRRAPERGGGRWRSWPRSGSRRSAPRGTRCG